MKLKPCPFCGRMPKLTAYKSKSRINCACGVTITYWDGLTTEEAEQAITTMWNRRTKLSLWKRIKTFFQRRKSGETDAE